MIEFQEAIRDAGLTPPEHIEPGRFHRFPGEGKGNGNRSAWCKLFEDGLGGVFGDWSTGLSEVWQIKREEPLDSAERQRRREQIKAAREQAAREREAAYAEAARQAGEVWKAARPASEDHPYLAMKGVKPHGIRQVDGGLVIPVRNRKQISSVQYIFADGNKRFFPGGRVDGYYGIGRPDGVLLLAEGFATGATLHEATGIAVAVAFNAGNLRTVAESLRDRPELNQTTIVVCADNDVGTEGNPGVTKATEVAQVIGGLVAVPPEDGDFNDYAARHGLEAVNDIVTEAISGTRSEDPCCREGGIPMSSSGTEFLDTAVARLVPDTDPLNWLEDYTVTPEEAEEFADPDFIVPGLIVQGHLHIVAAEPNGGKTTIFFHLAGEMAQEDFNVVYVNADISAGDAKSMVRQAEQKGITLALPEMKAGKSMENIVGGLRKMNQDGADLSRCVFIFDTLKKMADVINKRAAKHLMRLLRGLTAKGATIICLAHTNKYNGQDGKPIYEGTGDIRSDVDNLIYLIPDKRTDGSMLVSAEPDKTRAALQCATFEISPDRRVTRLEDFIDVAAEKARARQREEDQDVIERIVEAIQEKQIKQSAIIEYCREHHISTRRARNCLSRYANGKDRIWKMTRGFEKNAKFYELVESLPPVEL